MDLTNRHGVEALRFFFSFSGKLLQKIFLVILKKHIGIEFLKIFIIFDNYKHKYNIYIIFYIPPPIPPTFPNCLFIFNYYC